ncbi:hypothetical protein BU15DRAFT_51340 [Melanogaster broomeanus]|nr:hypothetical protein BU15DRAFT_51340 [Melanogaster broomeanus]
MCIGTERAEQIFVFDVLALKAYNLHPLMKILADPAVKKIMWDCRNDFVEILAAYGVALQGVLDLQLAEIESRVSVRGEMEWKRMARLAAGGRRLPLPVIKQNPDLFLAFTVCKAWTPALRRLASLPLARTVSTHSFAPSLVVDNSYVVEQVVNMHKTNGSVIWMERPLLPQLLQYAAHDIEMIGALYEHFKQEGWIMPRKEDVLVDQSMRYAYSLYYQGRVSDDDVFGSSSLLPLDVLREPRGLTVPCQGCHRMQSLHCFTISKRGRKIVARTNVCRVCQIKLLIKQANYRVSWVHVNVPVSFRI